MRQKGVTTVLWITVAHLKIYINGHCVRLAELLYLPKPFSVAATKLKDE